jgi:hypothetical protein
MSFAEWFPLVTGSNAMSLHPSRTLLNRLQRKPLSHRSPSYSKGISSPELIRSDSESMAESAQCVLMIASECLNGSIRLIKETISAALRSSSRVTSVRQSRILRSSVFLRLKYVYSDSDTNHKIRKANRLGRLKMGTMPPWPSVRLDKSAGAAEDEFEIAQLIWKVTIGELDIQWREDLQKG